LGGAEKAAVSKDKYDVVILDSGNAGMA